MRVLQFPCVILGLKSPAILKNPLSDQFVKGLTTASLQGRAQIVPDPYINMETPEGLVFYLDGAHSPESMEMCGKWFSLAIKKDAQKQDSLEEQPNNSMGASDGLVQKYLKKDSRKSSEQILLFNCMLVRDPQLLLPPLINTCTLHGVKFQKALFVPNMSVYNKVGSHTFPITDSQVDLTWQLKLQSVWEKLIHGDKGGNDKVKDSIHEPSKEDAEKIARNCANSLVFPSLPLAIKWLRDSVRQNKSVHFQVLVSGSLHLVGDVLRLIKK